MKNASVPNSTGCAPLSILSVSRTARPSDRDTIAVAKRHREGDPERRARASATPAGRRQRGRPARRRRRWGRGQQRWPCAGDCDPRNVTLSHISPHSQHLLTRLDRDVREVREDAVDPEREVLAQFGGEVARARPDPRHGAAPPAGSGSRAGTCTGARAGPRRARPRRRTWPGATRPPRRAARCGPCRGRPRRRTRRSPAAPRASPSPARAEQLHERDADSARRAASGGSPPRRTARTPAPRGDRGRCGAGRRRARARARGRSSGGRSGAWSRDRSRRPAAPRGR